MKNLKYKYLKTKIALSQTIHQLLEINRKKRYAEEIPEAKAKLAEEIRVLNATAENQARVLRIYEARIQKEDQAKIA